jgi:hypothetical protein
MLPSALAYELWLTGMGAGPSDRHHSILSYYRAQRGLGLPFRGMQGFQAW